VFSSGEIYDFKGKYSQNGTKTTSKADIPEAIVKESLELAITAYKAAGCSGMARVDCFLDNSNKLWLNEINPIPGFTHNSLYPSICRDNGLSGSHLADILIILGMARWRRQQQISRQSDLMRIH
jgi:UDP-N-acetylmuramate--alanine ligase